MKILGSSLKIQNKNYKLCQDNNDSNMIIIGLKARHPKTQLRYVPFLLRRRSLFQTVAFEHMNSEVCRPILKEMGS